MGYRCPADIRPFCNRYKLQIHFAAGFFGVLRHFCMDEPENIHSFASKLLTNFSGFGIMKPIFRHFDQIHCVDPVSIAQLISRRDGT